MLAGLILLALVQTDHKVFIPSWSGLQRPYAHLQYADKQPVSEMPGDESPDRVNIRFSFKSEKGDVASGVFTRPKADKRYPTIVLIHGLGDSRASFVKNAGELLLSRGFAIAAIDDVGHGLRMTKNDSTMLGRAFMTAMTSKIKGDMAKALVEGTDTSDVQQWVFDAIFFTVKDEQRVLDWLSSRKDVDYKRIGLQGYSLGSIIGSIIGAVDGRVKAMVLMVGGDPILPVLRDVPSNLRERGVFISPSLYASHYEKRAVLMVNGNKDTVVPNEAANRLYKAFPEGKKSISWYASDHMLPALSFREAQDWFTTQLKP